MKPARILIVDDESGSTRLLKANLELTGRYEVMVENRPENALPVARFFRPHLALLDVIMPVMSGTCLAAAFQADPDLKLIRIIFLTAAARSLMNEEMTAGLGSFPCVAKPVAMEDLLSLIENNLPRRETLEPQAAVPLSPVQPIRCYDQPEKTHPSRGR